MTSESRSRRRVSTPQLLILALILTVIAILTIHRLGSGPCGESAATDAGWLRRQFCGADVCGTNEAIEGVFVEQMVERGKILFPVENGRQPMYKPPLFHWTALAIDRTFGLDRVTAFNLRLPSVAYAVAGAALTMAFAASRISPTAGIIAGLVLAGSYQYIGQGRYGRVDMALTFCEALALFAFLWWLPAKSRLSDSYAGDGRATALRYLVAIALGLGVLAKGPVGAILPGLAILVFLLAERRFVEVVRSFVPGPAIVAIVIGSSWYVACYIGGRFGFLDRQLASENFGRFFGALGAMPPWYYLKPLFLNSAPLSLISPVAVIAALWMWRRKPREEDPNDGEAADRRRDAARLLAIFWIVTVVFFSIAAYKRRAYLLPLWPPAAVLIAWLAHEWLARSGGRLFRAAIVAACALLIVFNFFYLPWSEARDCAGESYRIAAASIDRAVGRGEPLYIYGLRGDPAPLLFYLHRDATPLHGRLGDAPPGYVIVPGRVWRRNQHEAPGLTPVLIAPYGREGLVLLGHGHFYASGVK